MRHSYKDTRDRVRSYCQAKFHKYGNKDTKDKGGTKYKDHACKVTKDKVKFSQIRRAYRSRST